MGWSVGYDENWRRDIGYGVPCVCDQPGCDAEIDRGLSYVCGQEPFGGDNGCGLYFCEDHLNVDGLCERCQNSLRPFDPKPDTKEWMEWKIGDESWAQWREENPEEVNKIKLVLGKSCTQESAS